MIPLWMPLLLDTSDVGEFSYNGCCKIFINGERVNNEWIVSVRVYARGFAWGCNKFQTNLRGPFSVVVSYYLTKVLWQLAEYEIEGKNELLPLIRHYLE